MLTEPQIREIVKGLMVTAESMGDVLSASAAAMMAHDLSDYPLEVILSALKKTRQECKGRLALADILKRVQGIDGHPEPNEAWSTAMVASDEAQTVVWTEQMAQAYLVAKPILAEGDKVGARMAFISAYERLVKTARDDKKPAEWNASLGHDAGLREAALNQAVAIGRIGSIDADRLLPAPMTEDGVAVAGLLAEGGKESGKKDGSKKERAACSEYIAARIEEIKAGLREADRHRTEKLKSESSDARADLQAKKDAVIGQLRDAGFDVSVFENVAAPSDVLSAVRHSGIDVSSIGGRA